MASETESPGFFRGLLAGVGEPALFAWQQAAGIGRVFLLTVHYTLRARWRGREILHQMYNIGNGSLVFICVVLGFLGMILIFQAGVQGLRIIGDLTTLGALFLQLLIREFAPTIGALMLATRVGTGIAAEIGSMVVTEQVDALRMTGAQPVQYLVVPRFIACTVMSLVLTVIGVLVAFVAGMLTARYYFGVNYHTFVDVGRVAASDIIVGVTKAVAYGMAIPVVSGQAGLAAFGGSEGVGWATTQAVVNASLAVVILDFLISGLAYMVF
jgi:phospholipid/cholesterol/gamma-HCH transport system permease protein